MIHIVGSLEELMVLMKMIWGDGLVGDWTVGRGKGDFRGCKCQIIKGSAISSL